MFVTRSWTRMLVGLMLSLALAGCATADIIERGNQLSGPPLVGPEGALICGLNSEPLSARTIGAEGNSIGFDGNSLVVPRGALNGKRRFTITHFDREYRVISLEPRSLNFNPNTPATLTLSYAGCDASADDLQVHRWTPATGWVDVSNLITDRDAVDQHIKVRLDGTSSYALVAG